MSNPLAIATVTATLKQMLEGPLRREVSGADVKMVRPDQAVPSKGVNIFLYQVSPNIALRNADLPTRRDNGHLTQRPQAALDLHYLFSFYGDEKELETQRLLGSAVLILHAQPLLTRQLIRDTIASADFKSFLGTSNLADAVELVKFTPLNLSLEDLSKLWSVFFQTPYALSVAYLASVVLLESDVSPQTALPVQERKFYALPFRQPLINSLEPQLIEFAAGAQIAVRGRNLLAPETIVQFGEQEATPTNDSSDERLKVTLPAGLRAGINPLQVGQRLQIGPPTLHDGFVSNMAAFILRPKLSGAVTFSKTGAPPDPRLTVTVAPQVGPTQRATLLLNETNVAPGATPRMFTLEARPRMADTGTLIFGAAAVQAATYLVRLRVDGGETLLDVDTDPTHTTFNQFIGPTVTVT